MDPEELANKLKNEQENTDYIGNIWGWKFSLFGLVLILFMSVLTYHSYKTGRLDMTTGEPVKKMEQQQKEINPAIDSLQPPK